MKEFCDPYKKPRQKLASYLIETNQEDNMSLYQKKKDGVYFTPSYLTEFILRYTVGEYFKEKSKYDRYNIKVLDPACGAGVFLNQTFDYLANKLINVDPKSILKNNIYGVDINEESVKLCRLSLFLKSISNLKSTSSSINELSKIEEVTFNIRCGDSIIDERKIAGHKAFLWEKEFPGTFFDVIIGNPPWGANIDTCSCWLAVKYPASTKQYKDTYKIFIDRSLSLLKDGGYLGFVVPNSFLYQSAYKDIKELLSHHSYTVVNLGVGIFEGVSLPAAILLVKKMSKTKGLKRVLDKQDKQESIVDLTDVKRDVLPHTLQTLELKPFIDKRDPQGKNVSICLTELTIGEVFELRDAGVQYASVGAGKENKGKSDLPDRLFSDKKSSIYCIPLYKGRNIMREGWLINHEIKTWLRKNPNEVLNKNEWVRYGEDIFKRKDKIVWRQTSDNIIAAIMDFESYFGKSIQAAVLKKSFERKVNLNYALAVFNSSYINYIYQLKVMEKKRVFPQVKLGYLKTLPFVIPSLEVQNEIASMVIELKNLYKKLNEKEKNEINFTTNLVDELKYKINQNIINIYKS